MSDTLDSRALRITDCYGQRFMKAGTYHYNVLPAHGHCVIDERPFTITVRDRTTQTGMIQHTVMVRSDAGKFRVEPPEVAIEAGDLVMWNCGDPRAAPYVVVGDKEFFGSHRLFNESGYSHAFGSAGEYHWMDAYGSGAAGVVRVKDPGCANEADFRRWHKSLTEASLVMIADGRADPRDVAIVTGQTVFFAVVTAPGISITDPRLLGGPDTKPGEPPAKPAPARPGRS